MAGHVEGVIAGAPVPWSDVAGEDFVGIVTFPAEVAAEVVIDCGGEGSIGDGVGWVVVWVILGGVSGRPRDAGVKAAEGFILIAKELFAVAGRGEAEVGFKEEGGGEAGEFFELGCCIIFLFRRNVGALEEGFGVVTEGELTGGFNESIAVTSDLFMVVGGCGEAGEEDGVAEIVCNVGTESSEVDQGGEEERRTMPLRVMPNSS